MQQNFSMWRSFPTFIMWRNFPLDNMSLGEFLHMTNFFSTDAVCGVCDKYEVWSDKLNDKTQIYLTWSSLGRVLYDLFYNSCLPLINLRSSWNSATGLLLFNNILKRLLRIGMACGPLNGGAATTLVLFRQWNWAYLTQLDSVCCTTKLARWVVTTRNLEA